MVSVILILAPRREATYILAGSMLDGVGFGGGGGGFPGAGVRGA